MMKFWNFYKKRDKNEVSGVDKENESLYNYKANRRSTIICDIDGCLLKHVGSLNNIYNYEPEILPGVISKFEKWKFEEHFIILITARPNSMRQLTKQQLEDLHIIYDLLITGVPHGARFLVNDKKPTMEETAIGLTIERNSGLINVDI